MVSPIDASLAWLGRGLARFLAQRVQTHGVAPETPRDLLLAALRPGDVLLVEGHSRISTAIKYLTQSTWSHATLYVGGYLQAAHGNSAHCFVEADIVDGVRSVGPEEYAGHHTRICRPVGLGDDARRAVCAYVIERIGAHYDLRNVVDLARYLLPTPPVPTRLRRRMLAFGSGDPTRAICSTLIAQAFHSIRYPILPLAIRRDRATPDCPDCFDEVLHIRHHSLFAPRDFDVSPYFRIIKPTLDQGFDHRSVQWSDDCFAAQEEAPTNRSTR
ncbi:C40 family peptidase [Marilutibacter alkalisoli]|uniref:Lipo-like protein n=1 Tax=Marilutibacter alkalisoli TaxID=2591633 RepID=A0A514BVR4_9GAMM|nr:lipo-like protein [Lysobacter alkalisoli]QDH71129.1 lipo-like protein [Lysobacter alkalisoli]